MHLHDILDRELNRFQVGVPLRILETGTIRGANQDSMIGDGWSTVWFAEHVRDLHGEGSLVESIDIDTSVASKVLDQHDLGDWVTLVEAHSIFALGWLLASKTSHAYDVILLDSDNDAQLIFHEFLLARQLLKKTGLLLIDDVQIPETKITGAKKGDVVLPYLIEHRIPYRLTERTGWRGYRTGVLAIDGDHLVP